MISLSDASILALTKLRTRRLRTLITVIISGLLFASLVAAQIISQGATASIHSFEQEGLNSRYIVSASTDPPLAGDFLENADLQNNAQQLYNQTVTAKTAEAKKLGIQYDPSTDIQPLMTLNSMVSGGSSRKVLNFNSPATQQAIADYAQAHPGPGMADLKKVAAPYHATGFYQIQQSRGAANGTLSVMEGGAENFSAYTESNFISPSHDILQNNPIELAPPQLTNPFLLHNVPKNNNPDAIPIVVPYSDAEQLLGLKSLSKGASPRQQLARIQELYTKASSIAFAACYRNSVSGTQISTAITQADAIAQNQGNKNYQKPSLIYGLPSADSCGQATILSDTRSTTEKSDDAKQDQFTQMFGGIVNPEQQKIMFRVVGLMPDQNNSSSTTFSGILQNIVGSSLGGAIVIPSDMFNTLPDASTFSNILFPTTTNIAASAGSQFYVEFADATNARNFINNDSCTTREDGTCATLAKPFQLSAFGSNSIALQDLQHKFSHYFRLAALAVVIVAAVIMSTMVGRTIADGRRETAVFRAVGAKRIDISCIYNIYVLCLSIWVALFALIAGVLLAYAFNHHFSLSTTVEAKLLYGATNINRIFSFYKISWPILLLIVGVVLVCGIISAVWPIIRNVRRSPIKDMREE